LRNVSQHSVTAKLYYRWQTSCNH